MEIWKTVSGLDARYEVSNLGNLRSNNYKRTGKTKLTKEQVEAARKQKAEGGRYWGRNELAKELGIASKHLQKIVNNKTSWMEY